MTWTKYQRFQYRVAPVADTEDIGQRLRVKARVCHHFWGSESNNIDETMLHFNLDEERTCIYCGISQLIIRRLKND